MQQVFCTFGYDTGFCQILAAGWMDNGWSKLGAVWQRMEWALQWALWERNFPKMPWPLTPEEAQQTGMAKLCEGFQYPQHTPVKSPTGKVDEVGVKESLEWYKLQGWVLGASPPICSSRLLELGVLDTIRLFDAAERTGRIESPGPLFGHRKESSLELLATS